MRVVFAGTPEFAATALEAIARAGHEIACVLTQPDRRAGRGLKPVRSAVAQLADRLATPVLQPVSLKDPSLTAALRQIEPEVMVVAAYGLIVPQDILSVPARGCINIHASLLPRWRGAAPIQRALIAGDAETGITIMQMDAGLDTGPVLLQEAVTIQGDDTAGTLHDRLASLGARLIVQALARPLTPQAQDDARATYAPKIDKREACIDWSEPAEVIERKVRALNPAPGAYTTHGATVLKIWQAAPDIGSTAAPGTVCEAARGRLRVACGAGTSLAVLEVQRAGGRRATAAALLAGHRLGVGERLGVA